MRRHRVAVAVLGTLCSAGAVAGAFAVRAGTADLPVPATALVAAGAFLGAVWLTLAAAPLLRRPPREGRFVVLGEQRAGLLIERPSRTAVAAGARFGAGVAAACVLVATGLTAVGLVPLVVVAGAAAAVLGARKLRAGADNALLLSADGFSPAGPSGWVPWAAVTGIEQGRGPGGPALLVSVDHGHPDLVMDTAGWLAVSMRQQTGARTVMGFSAADVPISLDELEAAFRTRVPPAST